MADSKLSALTELATGSAVDADELYIHDESAADSAASKRIRLDSLADYMASYNGALHIKSQGAVGDGTTDDSTAIQAVIDQAESEGKIVYGTGTYALATGLTTSVPIVGSAMFGGNYSALGGLVFKDTAAATGITMLTVDEDAANDQDTFIFFSDINFQATDIADSITGLKFVSALGLTSRFRLRNLRSRFCAVGFDLDGFIGTIDSCFCSSDDIGFLLRTANAVTFLGGEIQATGDIGIDIRSGSSISLFGTTVESDPGSTGVRVAEGVGTVLFDNCYFEGHNLDDTNEATGRHIIAGTTDSAGSAGTGDPNDAIQNITINGGLWVGSSSPGAGYKANVSMIELDNVNNVTFGEGMENKGSIKLGRARNVNGIATGLWNSSEGAYGSGWRIWEDSNSKGFNLKPIKNYVINPNGNGGPRGWEKVDVTNCQSPVEATNIIRSASTSLKVVRQTTDSGFPRIKLFPLNQADIVSEAPGKFWVVGCWVYADTMDAADEVLVQASYRDDAAEQNEGTSYSNVSTASNQFELDNWMFYTAWIEVVDDASTLTDFAIYISPGNDATSPAADEDIYIADIFCTLADGPLSGDQIKAMSTDTTRGMMLGDAVHYFASAAPTGANVQYNVGDITWDTAPAAAGTVGWVCTSAGIAGAATWKTFGTIAA